VKDVCLSVFVEMYKGWSDWNGTYEYRVELVNRKEPNKKIIRDFTSDFETSVSWGYNKFFKIDQLEREGFLDPQEDLVRLKFSKSSSLC
jgi:tripartite motif-containing protein 37